MANDEYVVSNFEVDQLLYCPEAAKTITDLISKYSGTSQVGEEEGAEASIQFETRENLVGFLTEVIGLPFIDTIVFPDRKFSRKTLEQLAKNYAKIKQEGETQ